MCIKKSSNNFMKSKTRKNTRQTRLSQRKMNQNNYQAAFCKYIDKIFAIHTIKIKVNTGADTCILTENQMQLLPFKLKIRKANTILMRYECSRITNIMATMLTTWKKCYSIIDVKKRYWHQEIDYQSSLLCTFNMPFKR